MATLILQPDVCKFRVGLIECITTVKNQVLWHLVLVHFEAVVTNIFF